MTRLLPLLPLALAAIVYAPVTRHYFFADDFLHLYRLANQPLVESIVEPFAGHLYLVRNAVFALLHSLFDVDPRGYFAAMLVTHLANVWLLYGVILVFTGSGLLACAGAALWGTAPVLAGVLGWYAVHGAALVATALLLFLRDLGRHARDGRGPGPGRIALWFLLLLAAATCWGTGIAVALVAPVVAWIVLPATPAARRAVVVLAALWVAVPLLYLADHWLWMRVYGGRTGIGFVLDQWRQPLAPAEMLLGLVGHGIAALHLGFLWPSGDAPSVAWWTAVGAYAASVVGVLVAGSAPCRRAVLALLLSVAATYGAIAAGRGNLYVLSGPTATPFSTGGNARYHYLGTMLLVVITCVAASAAASRPRLPAWVGWTLVGTLLAALAIVPFRRDWRMDDWSTQRRETAAVLGAIRQAALAQPPGSDVRIQNQPFAPVGMLVTPADFPGWAAAFVIFFPDDTVEGRRVHFVVSTPEELGAARDSRRMADLLVAP
jgi:hypothetical protein